ncbi:MAG: dihydropteroate synthase, partial [Nitrosarchaeum sp.]
MINHVTNLGNVGVGGKNPVRIMGILNTSPESFYKKSIKTTKQQITNTIKQMEIDRADFIDIGGMSTAPYLSTSVSEKIESQRILNAIKIIQNVSNLPISVDTCRANVAKSALEHGIEIINDISGLKYDDNMVDVIRKYRPSLILCAFDSK